VRSKCYLPAELLLEGIGGGGGREAPAHIVLSVPAMAARATLDAAFEVPSVHLIELSAEAARWHGDPNDMRKGALNSLAAAAAFVSSHHVDYDD
jgi:hypothetical protein